MTALITSNEEMEDVMKIIESHEESALLKVLVKQLKLKQKNNNNKKEISWYIIRYISLKFIRSYVSR